MASRQAIAGWVAAAIALALAAPAGAAEPERCFGIAKQGHNDCRSGRHVCSGRSTVDRDPASFIYLPAGLCEKIAGGSLTAKRV